MGEFRKLSDKISVDDSAINEVFLVNGQWQFTLPNGLSYQIDGEFTFIEGGLDLSGTTKPLVLKESWSVYDQAFCVAVEPHYSFSGDHMTIIDCKYDNRFGPNDGMNSQRVILDEPGFYVDLISVNMWPFGVEAQIRVRGDDIAPYNITMMVKPEGDAHWQHIADYFREIARSISKVAKTTKKTAGATKKKTVTDPNCIMSGTVLQRYAGWDENVVLPEGITELADNLFSGRDNLRSIVIPEGVKTIGRRAFENCFKLESVTLPESLRSIGGYAFVDCRKLKRINFGSKLEELGDSTFSECLKLENVTLPACLKQIDAFAFKNCREFTQIIIPEGVKSIGFTAFADCRNLEYLYIPASVTSIYDNFVDQTPFDGCEKLTIYCPEGSYAEEYAQSHGIRYVIDNTSKTAPKATRKTSAKQKDTTESAEKKNSKKSKDSDINWNLYAIDGKTLKHYWGKESYLVTPPGLKKIDNFAFNEKDFIQVAIISEGVQSLGTYAFAGCENLHTVILPETLKALEGFTKCNALETLYIPNSVTAIKSRAFSFCKNLKKIVIPPSVTKIGGCAFGYCEQLTDIYIPASVESIVKDAFDACEKLTFHVHPGSFAEEYAKRRKYKYDNNVAEYEKFLAEAKPEIPEKPVMEEDPFADFNITDDGKKLSKYIGMGGDVVIPEGITTIGAFAFGKCKISSVTWPKTITKLEENAFCSCKGIKTVELPASIRSIGRGTFSLCSALTNVVWSAKAKKIPEEAFQYCNALAEFIVPEGVTKIGKGAFENCGSLSKVILPLSVESIHENAFFSSNKVTLQVYSGSYAEQYAKEHKIPFNSVFTQEQLAQIEAERKRKEEERALQAARAAAAERQRQQEEEAKFRALQRAREEAAAERRRKEEEEAKLRALQRAQEEAAAERRRQEELAAKRARYDELQKNISAQEQIIAENRGWFGAQAKARKAAQEQLAILQALLAREFPNGRP